MRGTAFVGRIQHNHHSNMGVFTDQSTNMDKLLTQDMQQAGRAK